MTNLKLLLLLSVATGLSSGCAVAPLVLEKITTVALGAWGLNEHWKRQQEIEAVRVEVRQLTLPVEQYPP